jgi:hypothetical protein
VTALDVVRDDESLGIVTVQLGEFRLDTCNRTGLVAVTAIDDDLLLGLSRFKIDAPHNDRVHETVFLDVSGEACQFLGLIGKIAASG